MLYGSLARTGKGHGTDTVLREMFLPFPCEIRWDYEKKDLTHPNTLELYAYSNGKQTDFARVFSIGGGDIQFEGDDPQETPLCYPHHTFPKYPSTAYRTTHGYGGMSGNLNNSFEDYAAYLGS